MTTYMAQFSTGNIKRESDRDYISASAYVNGETGEIKNVTFSSKSKSAPSRAGIFCTPAPKRNWYKSRAKYLQAVKEQERLAEIWKVETVPLNR